MWLFICFELLIDNGSRRTRWNIAAKHIFPVISGYFLYVAYRSIKSKEEGDLFSELKKKRVIGFSAFLGLAALILLFLVFTHSNPNQFDFCKSQENGCLKDILQYFTFLNLVVFSVFFTLFIAVQVWVTLGNHSIFSILVFIGAIFVFIFTLLFFTFLASNLTNSFYREHVYLTRDSGGDWINFLVLNPNVSEKVLSQIILTCNKGQYHFDEKSCNGEIPYILPGEKVSKISCPIQINPVLDNCNGIRYVINGYWDGADRNLLKTNLFDTLAIGE